MKRCWIHIGMHKTGTTSIQQTLSTVPLPANWHYVKLGPYVNLGVPFFAMFSPDPTSYHWFRKMGQTHADAVARGKKWKAELKQMIENSTAEQFIMSGEAISLICREGTENMRKFLAPMFDEIQIIAYVRPPFGFRTSMFQQRIKNGRSKFSAINLPLVYRSRFEDVDEVFGTDKVHLLKFEPKTYTNGCVVTNFCTRMGLQLDPDTNIVRTNESLTREGLGVLFAYRKFGDGYGTGPTVAKENKLIFNALLEIKGEKFRLAPSLFSEPTPEDTKNIEWMESRLGEPLVEKIDPEKTDGISLESELLTISRDTCQAFVAVFEKLYDLKVPIEHIPDTDPVNPKAAADLVGYCRALYRNKYLTKQNVENVAVTSTLPIGDLVAHAAKQNELVLARLSKKRGRALVKGVFKAIEESLQSLNPGETIQIQGLGRFFVAPAQSSETATNNRQAKSIQFSSDNDNKDKSQSRTKKGTEFT